MVTGAGGSRRRVAIEWRPNNNLPKPNQKALRLLMFARILIALVVACSIGAVPAQAKEYPAVEVQDTFIDLRTGPGEGYPKVQIVERGDFIEILLRKTDWFKVRTRKGFEGWVYREDMERTLDADGDYVRISKVGQDEFAHRRWEAGVKIGDFEGSTMVGGILGYYFTENLSLEGSAAEALGDFSDSQLYSLSLTHQPWPQWRYSPYFTIGGGIILIHPEAQFIQTRNRTDQTVHAGLGIRAYVTRQFMLRGEYRSNVIMTNVDDNLEIEEWTLGFSAFF